MKETSFINSSGKFAIRIAQLNNFAWIFAILVDYKFLKFKTFKQFKLPKFFIKFLYTRFFLSYYIKTFFRYSLFVFPIYVIRKEYDYVDHASSSYPEKYDTGFSFWWKYHKDELREFFRPRDIDCGYNLYLDFISRDEYLNSKASSRDYMLEAFENGHPSCIHTESN